MRLRNVKNAMNIVNESAYTINEAENYKGHFAYLFNNPTLPLHLEIGMGKGNFIIGMAKKYPNINFIGVEKYESVMVRAIEKLNNEKLPNLKLIRYDASTINLLFDKEIDTLYLNFSDPWPKTRHAKRRLTSPIFLEMYNSIFKNNPHIIQKTDNIGLFAYSLSSLSINGYTLNRVSLDLHSEDIDNVETEYESKFSSKGVKINYVDAVKYLKK